MKKFLSLISLSSLAISTSYSAALLQWNFDTFTQLGSNSVFGGTAATQFGSTSQASGVESSIINIGAGLRLLNTRQNVYYARSIDFSTPADALANGDFYEFSVQATSGNAVTVDSIDILARRQGGNDHYLTLFSSLDGFAAPIGTSQMIVNSTIPTLITLPVTGVANVPQVTFRVVAYADATVDTFSNIAFGVVNTVDGLADINVNGSLSAVPEPSAYAALFGLGALGFVVIRRRRK